MPGLLPLTGAHVPTTQAVYVTYTEESHFSRNLLLSPRWDCSLREHYFSFLYWDFEILSIIIYFNLEGPTISPKIRGVTDFESNLLLTSAL
jgi:hypothetical protein